MGDNNHGDDPFTYDQVMVDKDSRYICTKFGL